jgi:hypothetical protein
MLNWRPAILDYSSTNLRKIKLVKGLLSAGNFDYTIRDFNYSTTLNVSAGFF